MTHVPKRTGIGTLNQWLRLDQSVKLQDGKWEVKNLRKQSAPKKRTNANIARNKRFSIDALLKHIDPGASSEAEEFVQRIYEQRRLGHERPALQ